MKLLCGKLGLCTVTVCTNTQFLFLVIFLLIETRSVTLTCRILFVLGADSSES